MGIAYDLRCLTLPEFTGRDWDLFHEFRVRYHAECFPDDPFTPRDVYETRVRQQLNGPDMDGELCFVFESGSDSKLLGVLMFAVVKESSEMLGKNSHLLFAEIQLLKAFRRRGLGSQLLVHVLDRARKHGKELIFFSSQEEDGIAFLSRIGADLSLSSIENRLYLSEVDWGMVEDWVRLGRERNEPAGTRLMFFERVPDELLDEYSRVYTEVMNQVPTGSLDLRDLAYSPDVIRRLEAENAEAGVTSLRLVTVERDGRISGLTEMSHVRGIDDSLFQGLTGVREEFRGRGLGKWLKASMLLRVREQYPSVKFIRTDNATSNAPMLSINERLGFRVHRRVMSSQLRVSVLESYLRERGLIEK